ncbi:MAG: hypothetical protein P4L50_08010 [Anaerolineaceae bacterium]|nr:hypothetical protein [Anaerolineaceae bacterium]
MGRFHYNELVTVKLQSDAFLYIMNSNADGHLVCRVASPSLPSMTVIETRPEVIQAFYIKSANFLAMFNAPCRVEITSDTRGKTANTQVILRSDRRALNKNRLKVLKMGAFIGYPVSTGKMDFYHTEQVPERTGETGYIFLSN